MEHVQRRAKGRRGQARSEPQPFSSGSALPSGNWPGTTFGVERVTGIGGFFFRARDPEALSLWYQTHLGIDPVPSGPGQRPWTQQAGVTAFSPFAADTDYFGDAQKQWMLNFRVGDLPAMVAQLRAAGIEVTADAEPSPYGAFARLHDPDGNPIELWQPP